MFFFMIDTECPNKNASVVYYYIVLLIHFYGASCIMAMIISGFMLIWFSKIKKNEYNISCIYDVIWLQFCYNSNSRREQINL